MNYLDGEILIAAQVVQVTGFSASNVGRGTKWKWLNSGKSDRYAVLHKAQHVEAFDSHNVKNGQYRTIIEVIQRVNNDLTDNYDALITYAEDIATRLDRYRKLADTAGVVRDAQIGGGDEIKEIWTDGGKVLAWIKVDLFMDWRTEENVTFAE